MTAFFAAFLKMFLATAAPAAVERLLLSAAAAPARRERDGSIVLEPSLAMRVAALFFTLVSACCIPFYLKLIEELQTKAGAILWSIPVIGFAALGVWQALSFFVAFVKLDDDGIKFTKVTGRDEVAWSDIAAYSNYLSLGPRIHLKSERVVSIGMSAEYLRGFSELEQLLRERGIPLRR